MNKLFACFSVFVMVVVGGVNAASFTSCGAGYVLTAHSKMDGIETQECKKLWCMDLETGKSMGHDKVANNGYKTTSAPVELCDASRNCVECFGERKWCGGEVAGVWNPEYGAYTRGGEDNATYSSYLKGGCFAWRLEKPDCADGQTAVLTGGKWHCVTASGSEVGSRASSVRRTGAIRKRF